MCLSYLVVDEQLKKENVNIGQATLDSATSQAEHTGMLVRMRHRVM